MSKSKSRWTCESGAPAVYSSEACSKPRAFDCRPSQGSILVTLMVAVRFKPVTSTVNCPRVNSNWIYSGASGASSSSSPSIPPFSLLYALKLWSTESDWLFSCSRRAGVVEWAFMLFLYVSAATSWYFRGEGKIIVTCCCTE